MSDTHAWPHRTGVEAAFVEFEAFRDRLRTLMSTRHRDDPVLGVLIGELSAFDALVERVRPNLGPFGPATAPDRRAVGEDTRAWICGDAGQMRRNRGPQ